jgi:hypothetical protein
MSVEDRLWDVLEPAALREAQRPRVARPRLPALRPAVGLVVMLIVLAAGAAVIAVLARPVPHPATPRPEKVTSVKLGAGLGDVTAGFGSVWIYDVADRRLLRVDAATHRPVEWVNVPNRYLDVALATGAGAVWAVPVQNTGHMAAAIPSRPLRLVRIDPQTGRTIARIPIRIPGGGAIMPFGIEITDAGVWVWGQTGAVRIDPRTNRVALGIAMPNDAVKGFALDGNDVWIATEGARLLRFDAATGKRLTALRGRPQMVPIPVVSVRGAVVYGSNSGTLYAVDATTGRSRWRTPLPGRARSVLPRDGRIWILTTSASSPNDELVALDPDTGRAVARVGLPTGDGVALQAVGSDLWVTGSGGDVHIVHHP